MQSVEVRWVDTAFTGWNNLRVLDLNDLRVFEKVATLRSFSSAARALGLPKSSVSRSVGRLEEELGVRLFQRTTRAVLLTPAGEGLKDRCTDILGRVGDALDYVGSLGAVPRGTLKISAGIGFGINVLADQLPAFLRRYPDVTISLDLTHRAAELVAEGVDVAIRLGPMPDSELVAVRLGSMKRYLCAAPTYLEARGMPRTIEDLREHDTIEMPGVDGRARRWSFTRNGETAKVELKPRVSVNDALTIQRLVVNGAGLGIISGYLCAPDIAAGRLVRLFPEWTAPPVDVSLVFPSNRELAPTVRAFVDFVKETNSPGQLWQQDPLLSELRTRP